MLNEFRILIHILSFSRNQFDIKQIINSQTFENHLNDVVIRFLDTSNV